MSPFFSKDKDISKLIRRVDELESKITLQGTKIFEVSKRFSMISELFDEVISSSGERIRSLQNALNRAKKKDDSEDMNIQIKKGILRRSGILPPGE